MTTSADHNAAIIDEAERYVAAIKEHETHLRQGLISNEEFRQKVAGEFFQHSNRLETIFTVASELSGDL